MTASAITDPLSRTIRNILLLFASATLLAACGSSRGGSIPYEVQNFGVPDAPSETLLAEDYRIAPLDKLAVTVFQVEDLSGEFQVDLTGHIALPLIGNVRAVDMTTAELQNHLEARYSESYLNNPDITVGITESAGSRITVEGAVRQPGVFPVTGRLSLVQAIAMARGPNDTANQRRVAIFRQIDGQRQAAAFDLIDIRRGEAQDPEVYRGDIIVVDGSGIRAFRRELLQTIPILNVFAPVGAF